MIPRDKRQAPQRDLLETYLEDILNPRHELVQMGKRIDWTACEQHFGRLYAVEAGRPGLPIRLHVGLQLRILAIPITRSGLFRSPVQPNAPRVILSLGVIGMPHFTHGLSHGFSFQI